MEEFYCSSQTMYETQAKMREATTRNRVTVSRVPAFSSYSGAQFSIWRNISGSAFNAVPFRRNGSAQTGQPNCPSPTHTTSCPDTAFWMWPTATSEPFNQRAKLAIPQSQCHGLPFKLRDFNVEEVPSPGAKLSMKDSGNALIWLSLKSRLCSLVLWRRYGTALNLLFAKFKCYKKTSDI